ncbi:mechanosensitive ion channel family protein [Jiulongibacter sediminis]|uniref:mechanosensitive ion channel family protein n=1 Tax=Jiulongibacter sediminis TaxID=1605367 RepID=UPI0026F27051|nr:mechanosensitive ion channel family protein [Jiulongibacter sediminis]
MNFDTFLDSRFFELVATAVGILIFFIVRSITDGIIKKQAKKHGLDKARSVYARKFFDITYLLILLLGLGFVWDIEFKGIFASFFAVAGVALLASWSMLSNITASVLLFFNFPFKIGSRIKIMDKDDSVIGVVKDITFFAIQIEDENGDLVSYPNNVAIQKAIVQLKNSKSVK